MQKSLFDVIPDVCGLLGASLPGFIRSSGPNFHSTFIGCLNYVRYYVKSMACITPFCPHKNLRDRRYFYSHLTSDKTEA